MMELRFSDTAEGWKAWTALLKLGRAASKKYGRRWSVRCEEVEPGQYVGIIRMEERS